MLFNSLHFLLFFPIIALFYFIIPHKFRWLWLLFASYFFYMSWNPFYGILLFSITIITWLAGILAGQPVFRQSTRKICLIGGIILTLSFLIYFKYADFIYVNILAFFNHVNIELTGWNLDIVLPVGISFYTFQALGYVIDVYRGKIKAEMNPARHALFVSFFPQLLAGPIGRAEDLKPQLFSRRDFNYEDARYGLLLMLWGYFQKIVIADHAAVLVNKVYDNFHSVAGYQIILATLLFAVQIYCDFAAYSAIAIGAARIMGIKLSENFRQPYLAVSVQDFWRRWHITLSTWFRDYLYIPLGGNRVSRLKKYRNIMITFLISGLWHGAGWNFIVWGGLHGFYQIAGDLIKPNESRGIRQMKKCNFLAWLIARGNKYIRIFMTFTLVTFAWLFFRANGLTAAVHMIRRVFTGFMAGEAIESGSINPILIIGIIVLIVVDICRERFDVFTVIFKQKALVRWIVYYSLMLTIIIFGMYGSDYVQTNFIYFDF